MKEELLDVIISGQLAATIPAANRETFEQVHNNEGTKFILRPHLSDEEKQKRIDAARQSIDMGAIKEAAKQSADQFKKTQTELPIEAHPNVDEPPQIHLANPKKSTTKSA
jgi:predicted HAD superfamily phosphohydrolase YqeG